MALSLTASDDRGITYSFSSGCDLQCFSQDYRRYSAVHTWAGFDLGHRPYHWRRLSTDHRLRLRLDHQQNRMVRRYRRQLRTTCGQKDRGPSVRKRQQDIISIALLGARIVFVFGEHS